MGNASLHEARAERRRHRLFPALSVRLRDGLEPATTAAIQGGSLAVTLTNNGLATAFRPYVEATRMTFPVRSVINGYFVWDVTDTGTGFWRRARRGERFRPDRRVVEPVEVPNPEGSPSTGRRYRAEGPGSYPESFRSGEAVAERLARVAAVSLAPTQAAEVAIQLPALPPEPGGDQLTGWCLMVRCFDLLTDPPPPVQFPAPALPAHHVQLICLHTVT
jgi:hypothetical protein